MEENQQYKVSYSFEHVNQQPYLADGYKIYRQDGESSDYVLIDTITAEKISTNEQPVFVTGIDYVPNCGVLYNYKVSAYNARGEIECINPLFSGIDFICPTLTPTVTPSVTKTPSVTPSVSTSVTPSVSTSVSLSVSPSITPSTSLSKTPTVTPSITPSVTPSVTQTATPPLPEPSQTASPSVSISPSVTPSTSLSVTPSASLSVTPSTSLSVSVTPSITPSRTVTPSTSLSVSVTPSTSLSVSVSPSTSLSVTPSASLSVTPSVTPSTSLSVTPSTSLSITPSTSLSVSVSPSTSLSVTPSTSLSVTPSVTPSTSLSVTPSTSLSVTPSVTPSTSLSVTPSTSLSITPSTSLSLSVTPSITPSRTVTPSTSLSVTPSVSPSKTPSVTPSITPSRTVTPSTSLSVTPSVSPSTSAPEPSGPTQFTFRISHDGGTSLTNTTIKASQLELINDQGSTDNSLLNWPQGATSFTLVGQSSTKDGNGDATLGGEKLDGTVLSNSSPEYGGFVNNAVFDFGTFSDVFDIEWSNGSTSVIPEIFAASSDLDGLYDFGLVQCTVNQGSQDCTTRTNTITKNTEQGTDNEIAFHVRLAQDQPTSNDSPPSPGAVGSKAFFIEVIGQWNFD